ncbi:MAG TPA: hypothetical protein VNJ52_08275 [Patescibacteria group bacterium]|nr:hypothetical protein [Patescibacteria group bacterium]
MAVKRAEAEKSPANGRASRRLGAAGAVLVTGAMLLAGAACFARGKPLIWKPVEQALLKENNRPVKTWNVYQPDKEREWVLVQVERNWFIFNTKEKRVYKAERADFHAHGDSLIGPEPGRHTPPLKTDGWDSHDVGPAQQISVRIAATGNVLAIELPHPLAVY